MKTGNNVKESAVRMEELKILYEDREILVAVKPEGVDSEAAGGFGKDMVNLIRNHLEHRI